jgi:hypothetical protein
MQTQSEELRARATECQELADHSRELMKEQYEQLARQWLFLAEHAKAREELPQCVVTWKRINYQEADRRHSPFCPTATQNDSGLTQGPSRRLEAQSTAQGGEGLADRDLFRHSREHKDSLRSVGTCFHDRMGESSQVL